MMRVYFAWYDFWVGMFWDRDKRILYVCPLPMLVIEIRVRARRPNRASRVAQTTGEGIGE